MDERGEILHSPAEGLIDIKPPTIYPLISKDIIFLSLAVILILICIVLLFRRPIKFFLKGRIYKKSYLTPIQIAYEKLDLTKNIKDKKEFSEQLLLILKTYLTALGLSNINSKTSHEVSVELKTLLSEKLPFITEEIKNHLSLKINEIFKNLEFIEYRPVADLNELENNHEKDINSVKNVIQYIDGIIKNGNEILGKKITGKKK